MSVFHYFKSKRELEVGIIKPVPKFNIEQVVEYFRYNKLLDRWEPLKLKISEIYIYYNFVDYTLVDTERNEYRNIDEFYIKEIISK